MFAEKLVDSWRKNFGGYDMRTNLQEVNKVLQGLQDETLNHQDQKLLIELKERVEEVLEQINRETKSILLIKRSLETKATNERKGSKIFSQTAKRIQRCLDEKYQEIRDWEEIMATILICKR